MPPQACARSTPTTAPSLAPGNGLDNLALADALPLINRLPEQTGDAGRYRTGTIRIGGIYNISEVNNLVPSLPKVLPVYLTQNQDGNPVLNSIPRKAPKG